MNENPLKLLYISDMDVIGSGYMNIAIPLCEGLSKRGHDVKVCGIGYRGQEHFFDFSIIPCTSPQESLTMFQSVWNMWHYDVLIVAMDVYVHNPFLNILMQKKPFGYVGIMPIEAPPLCMTWAMVISQMDKPFIISEFGAVEARRAGVMEAEHLQIGVDTESWKPAKPEEKAAFRNSILGLDDDTFVVLTVADNQERKNLAAAMEIFKEFAKDKKALYVLVTRENSPVGWRLRDYAQELGILNKFMLFERGMPFKELWMMYACADVFLLPSKTEGLGMCLLEAMAMKIPCIATECTGMKELLGDSRGILVPAEYTHRDCFGNGTRWWIDKKRALQAIEMVYKGALPDIEGARQYVEDRDWQPSVLRLEEVLLKIRSEREQAKDSGSSPHEG